MIVELKRILLVEDDPNDAELTLEGLTRKALANQVDWVRDGQEALDYLLKQGAHAERPNGNPFLIILDINLPKLSGLEVLRRIRATPDLRLIPVVLLTSSREDRDLMAGYELGANAYVVKPVRFGEFIAAVQELGIFWALVNQPPGHSPTPRN